jgi:deoxyadenosine/deoxycytidine kinase
MDEHRFIAVAGNMGVGKSTLVQFLTMQFNGEPFYEPVDTNPYFVKFFKDMGKWSFHSQIYFLTHKFRIHQAIQKKSGLVVLDRSIYEDAEIFAKGLSRAKKMTHDEFALYWDLYEAMCKSLRPPDLVIYLTCSIKKLKERINERGRAAEKNVPDAHLKRLQRAYDDWIKRIDFCEVITIATDNLNYISDLVHRANVIELLSKYL